MDNNLDEYMRQFMKTAPKYYDKIIDDILDSNCSESLLTVINQESIPLDLRSYRRFIKDAMFEFAVAIGRRDIDQFFRWTILNGFSYNIHAQAWYHKDFPNAVSEHCNVWYETNDMIIMFNSSLK